MCRDLRMIYGWIRKGVPACQVSYLREINSILFYLIFMCKHNMNPSNTMVCFNMNVVVQKPLAWLHM